MQHIDLFVHKVTERTPKRFTDINNLPSVPERHKVSISKLLRKTGHLSDGYIAIISFHESGQDMQHFRWISPEQFRNLYNNINWQGQKQELKYE